MISKYRQTETSQILLDNELSKLQFQIRYIAENLRRSQDSDTSNKCTSALVSLHRQEKELLQDIQELYKYQIMLLVEMQEYRRRLSSYSSPLSPPFQI
jgi:hypothetical protein